MARAWFKYKGISSTDMHLHIENDISFPSPETDVEFTEILGRDGDIAVDNKRLKSVPFPIRVRIKTPPGLSINEIATEISNWLKSDVGFYPLEFSGSPDYEYIAMCNQQFDIEETLKNYGKTVIMFRLQPFKRYKRANLMVVNNNDTLHNKHSRKSLPLIEVKGSGDINIKNNGVDWLKLRSVNESVTVDSELGQVYKGNRPQYDKVIDLGENQFPVLNKGENKITWEGNVTKLEILPRWEAIT